MAAAQFANDLPRELLHRCLCTLLRDCTFFAKHCALNHCKHFFSIFKGETKKLTKTKLIQWQHSVGFKCCFVSAERVKSKASCCQTAINNFYSVLKQLFLLEASLGD